MFVLFRYGLPFDWASFNCMPTPFASKLTVIVIAGPLVLNICPACDGVCGSRATFLMKDKHFHFPDFLTIKLNLNDARKGVQQQTALMFFLWHIQYSFRQIKFILRI